MLNYDECRVNVFTQLFENGKPKGGVTYTFVVDSDIMFFAEERVIVAMERVLADLSSEDSRVEYISHEVVFQEPTDITARIAGVVGQPRWLEFS
jgi:hypothetical protein